jgi:hypothetical protein
MRGQCRNSIIRTAQGFFAMPQMFFQAGYLGQRRWPLTKKAYRKGTLLSIGGKEIVPAL